MTAKKAGNTKAGVSFTVAQAKELGTREIDELCDATEAAIRDGGGFGWIDPPTRSVLERYWSGVLLIPERSLFIAKLDDVVCGSVQLQEPARNAEATAFSVRLTTFFLAPWARGYGIARPLIELAEARALESGYLMINLDVRETQDRAIQLYEALGFARWGTNPNYARVRGRMIAGHFYSKAIGPLDDTLKAKKAAGKQTTAKKASK